MAMSAMPFFDPQMAQQHRQLAFDTETQTADYRLQGERMVEDQNLFRPFLERRFNDQSKRSAGNVAGRGFFGPDQGIMNSTMGRLGEEQAYTMGEFERQSTRGLEDVERAIANLTARNTMSGAEATRGGAGRASERAYPRFTGI